MSDCQTILRESESCLDGVLQQCATSIAAATVPLVAMQDDRFVHDRTGVLYRIGDRHLILTASHAGRDGDHDLRAILNNGAIHCILPNQDGALPIPLTAPAGVHGTEVDGRDVAFIDLPEKLAAEVRRYYRFISHDEVNPGDNERAWFYLLVGYPEDWSLRKVGPAHLKSEPLVFLLRPYAGDIDPDARYEQGMHVLFGFEREAVDLRERKRVDLPKPRGMSGGGIWRVTAQSDSGIQSASSSFISLVGIQNRWQPRLRYVAATRVDWVLNRILDDHPELERPMRLTYIKNVRCGRIVVPSPGDLLLLPR